MQTILNSVKYSRVPNKSAARNKSALRKILDNLIIVPNFSYQSLYLIRVPAGNFGTELINVPALLFGTRE